MVRARDLLGRDGFTRCTLLEETDGGQEVVDLLARLAADVNAPELGAVLAKEDNLWVGARDRLEVHVMAAKWEEKLGN